MMKIFRHKINYLFLAAAFFLASSCGKEDSDEFIATGTVSGADTNWVTSVATSSPVQELKQLLTIAPKIDSCEATAPSTLQFPDGLQVSIPANSFISATGQLTTGKIQVEAMIIRKKGDAIKVDRPTISQGKQLILAGEVFLRIKKNGEEQLLAPGKKVAIRYSDVSNNTNILTFKGEESNLEKFNWIQTQDTTSFATQGAPHYEVYTNALKWSSLQFLADTTGPRITVLVSAPANYTNANTMVYLVYRDIKSVLGLYGSTTNKKFLSGKVQTGKVATVVLISKQGPNSYYLYHDNITTGFITPSNGNQVVLAQPQPTSISDIKAYLEML